jgi:hypothetical protein
MPLDKPSLPDFLITGERARLIPVVSDGSKESRATSILLSTLSAVHEYAQNLLGAIGIRVGVRTKIEVYTEIVFKDKTEQIKLRPDGLLIIETPKGQWRALIEAKVGNAEIQEEQVKNYLALAKKHKIDAVITISNQYSALPTHHPIPLKKSDLKGVELYHWSWMFILTEAILLLKSLSVEDEDQQFLLSEMVRYFNHPSVGVSSFTQMNKEWKDVNTKVRSGAKLAKTSDEVKNTLASWHQETRDLCLIMSRKVAVPVSLKLPRKHKNNPSERLKDDCEQFVTTNCLACELEIPNTASTLTVTADMARRTLNCAMRVEAPKDRKTAVARVNWLLRQIKDIPSDEIFIKAVTLGKSNNPQAPLTEVRENPQAVLFNQNNEIQPIAFEVMMIRDVAGKFSGRNTFIETAENTVTSFYEIAGQNLQSWTPAAPKIKKDKPEGLPKVGHQESVILTPKGDDYEETEIVTTDSRIG